MLCHFWLGHVTRKIVPGMTYNVFGGTLNSIKLMRANCFFFVMRNVSLCCSCFLLAMKDDSIEGIYDTLKQCALISKSAGGVGLHVHCIRAAGSFIAGVCSSRTAWITSGLFWTVSVPVKGTAGPVERLGTLQICAPVVRPKRFPTSLNPDFLPAEWWFISASICWWYCYCLVDQLWILIAHARRRSRITCLYYELLIIRYNLAVCLLAQRWSWSV